MADFLAESRFSHTQFEYIKTGHLVAKQKSNTGSFKYKNHSTSLFKRKKKAR